MPPSKLLVLLLSALLFASAISVADATINKTYTQDHHDSYGNRTYSFEVETIVETEADNKWVIDSQYLVTFIITLTYVNQSIYQPVGFYLHFFSPSVRFSGEIVQNGTNVSLGGNSGALSYRANASPLYGQSRITLQPFIYYLVYVDYELFMSAQWDSLEPIYLDTQPPASTPSLLSPELIFMIAGVLIGAGIIGSYFVIRTRRRNPDQKYRP